MKKYYIFIISFFFLIYSCLAQNEYQFKVKKVKSRDSDVGHSITVDLIGNIYITGRCSETLANETTSTSSVKEWDIFITKFNKYGEQVWDKVIKSNSLDFGYDIVYDGNKYLYLTGCFSNLILFDNKTVISKGLTDIFLAKYDTSGNLIWVKQAGGRDLDIGASINLDKNNNIYLTGYYSDIASFDNTTITSIGNSNIFLAKYDTTGNLVWIEESGGSYKDEGKSIGIDSKNNIYLSGSFGGTGIFGNDKLQSNGDWDVFLSKYNNNNSKIIWSEQLGNEYFDKAYDINIDKHDNIYLCGSIGTVTQVTYQSNIDNTDIFLARYNIEGKQKWLKKLPGTDFNRANAVITDSSGNVYVTGSFRNKLYIKDRIYTSNGDADIFIAEFDNNGNLIWFKQIGGKANDEGFDISIDKDQYLYITGTFGEEVIFDNTKLKSVGKSDAFILKLDTSGRIIWIKQTS